MCSISGMLLPEGGLTETERQYLERIFDSTICNAADRGRDSYGVWLLTDPAEVIAATKRMGPPQPGLTMPDDAAQLINNNRAEPTTEWVEDKLRSDIQPFREGHWIVAHNGTIANDKELKHNYDLKTMTEIDTAVIPAMLDKMGPDVFWTEIADLLLELKGSYALSMTDVRKPRVVWLAANYKPLHIAVHHATGTVIWTSLPDYLEQALGEGNWTDRLTSHWRIERVPPFTLLQVEASNGRPTLRSYNFKNRQEDNKRALVICSGGLDSTTVAVEYISRGYEVDLLHFRYGARAQDSEVDAIQTIADRIGAGVKFMDVPAFATDIGHSPLTGTGDLVTARRGEMSAEYAHEWVPARNTVFLSFAVAMAEAWGYREVALGNNLEESGAFPDNEVMLTRLFNEMLPWVINEDKFLQITSPVANLMKHEIVKKALTLEQELGINFLDITHSCYEKGQPCGSCGPDYMRMKAFKMNGVIDPIEYLEPTPEDFWDGCREWKGGFEWHGATLQEPTGDVAVH